MDSTHAAQPYSAMAGKLHPNLLKAISLMGFGTMTPVQHRVLTDLRSWRDDCLVQAKTGTGKTLAFLLPALQCQIQNPPTRSRAQVAILVITPTRELAQQIKKQCDQLTSQLSKPLECHIAVGGTARGPELKRFMNGAPSILVATPGRLKDYLSEEATARRFDNLQTLVLDEADTMLESGFLADVKGILNLVPNKSTGWQGMCFSATIPARVREVCGVVLRPGYTNISTVDPDESPTIDKVPQYLVTIPAATDTFNALYALLRREMQSNSKIIVFGVTANMVALFAKVFSQNLLPFKVLEIHSRLSQNARTRTTAEFKEAGSGVLFASDVVGRGMDFPNTDLVVQVGIPSSGEQYVHRVGRTARAGNDGLAIMILTESESFFTIRNKHLPIKPYPHSAEVLNDAAACAPTMMQAMYNIDEITKQRAYSSFLGFFAGSGLMKSLRLDKPGLVALANDLAMRGMGCPEPPPMDKKVIGKMGLKGIPGFTYAGPNDLPKTRPMTRPHPDQQRNAPKPGDISKSAGGRPRFGDDKAEKTGGRPNARRGGRGRGGKAQQ